MIDSSLITCSSGLQGNFTLKWFGIKLPEPLKENWTWKQEAQGLPASEGGRAGHHLWDRLLRALCAEAVLL